LFRASPIGASIIFESVLRSPGSPGISSPGSAFTRRSAFGLRNMTGFGSTIALSIRP